MRKLFLILALLYPSLSYAITGTTCPGDGCKDINVGGQGTIGVQITGTWTGTITFKASIDGSNFTAISALPIGSAVTVTTTTSNGFWTITCAGIKTIRVQFTSGGTGTANVSTATAQAKGGAGTGGGGGSPPGGSNTQLQYNNAGVFGGISGATTNGTAVTLTSPVITTPTINSLTYPASDGTSGQVIVTNGTGTLSFADVIQSTTTIVNNIKFGNGKGLTTDIHTNDTLVFQAYDTDDLLYRTFATLTAANTPSFDISAPAGGTLSGNYTTLKVGGVDVATGTGAFTNAGNCQGAVTAAGGSLCRDTTNNILYRKADGLASSAYGWYRTFYDGPLVSEQPTRFSWTARPPGSSLAGDNIQMISDGKQLSSTGSPTLSGVRSTDGYYMFVTTGSTAGAQGELYDTQFGATEFQWSLYDFDIAFKIRTDASSIADTRIFVGIGTADPTNADTLTGRQIGFRYSSGIGAQWDAYARDNTTTNVTSNINSAAANTAYLFRIRFTASSHTACWSINDGTETCNTTNVPSDTTNPYIYVSVFNVAGTGGTRSFGLRSLGGWNGF